MLPLIFITSWVVVCAGQFDEPFLISRDGSGTEPISETTTAKTSTTTRFSTAETRPYKGALEATYCKVGGDYIYWEPQLQDKNSNLYMQTAEVFLRNLKMIFNEADVDYTSIDILSFEEGSTVTLKALDNKKSSIIANYVANVDASIPTESVVKSVETAFSDLNDNGMFVDFGLIFLVAFGYESPSPPGMDPGILAAIIVSSVVVAFLLALVVFYFVYRHRSASSRTNESGNGVSEGIENPVYSLTNRDFLTGGYSSVNATNNSRNNEDAIVQFAMPPESPWPVPPKPLPRIKIPTIDEHIYPYEEDGVTYF